MELRNFWLIKRRETEILRIVAWAQQNNIKVEELTEEQIREALSTRR
jgi:hypothetical protein